MINMNKNKFNNLNNYLFNHENIKYILTEMSQELSFKYE